LIALSNGSDAPFFGLDASESGRALSMELMEAILLSHPESFHKREEFTTLLQSNFTEFLDSVFVTFSVSSLLSYSLQLRAYRLVAVVLSDYHDLLVSIHLYDSSTFINDLFSRRQSPVVVT
jgi:Guanine nucleotide exchange factor in Golgi transport N-terminal